MTIQSKSAPFQRRNKKKPVPLTTVITAYEMGTSQSRHGRRRNSSSSNPPCNSNQNNPSSSMVNSNQPLTSLMQQQNYAFGAITRYPHAPMLNSVISTNFVEISRVPPPVSVGPAQAPPPPPYVDHNHVKKIRSDVNVHKESVRVVVDEENSDAYLVSFTFDALVDGCFTIFYFAKEGANCTFMPVYPEIYMPRMISFKRGLGQKFCQPSGTGIDLGFFELSDLSKPSSDQDIFPLVISAECLPSMDAEPEQQHQPMPTSSSHAQITQAVLLKDDDDRFQVKVVKQILWVGGARYELQEIYGIGNSNDTESNDNETGKECVICMTSPKDTTCLPCRHMCLCGDCAKELRLQSNKCPICRQKIQELLEIKIRNW